MKYLIIGGGISGTSAAEELRKINGDAEITILSTEVHPLYSRVLLPRYIKGILPRERCFLKTPAWYDEHRIRPVFGVCADKLDTDHRTVSTTDGRVFPFDKLLLATSGNLLKFPADLRGVSYLRTIDDADHFLDLLAELNTLPKGRARAGIVGGSFIAVEYINFFAQHKIPTDLFMLENSFFGNALDEDSFAILNRRIAAEGITVHPSTVVTSLEGNDRLEGVKTADGSFPLGLLGVGIGIRPDFSWLSDSGIEVNLGILTNEYLETNIPDIYSCGDVAEFYDLLAERRSVVGNWLNAHSQGRHVAKTMSGERTAFSAVRAYSTNVCGIEIIFVGDTDVRWAERIVRLGSFEEGGVTQILTRNGRVVGATLVNRNKDRVEMTNAVRERLKIS